MLPAPNSHEYGLTTTSKHREHYPAKQCYVIKQNTLSHTPPPRPINVGATVPPPHHPPPKSSSCPPPNTPYSWPKQKVEEIILLLTFVFNISDIFNYK